MIRAEIDKVAIFSLLLIFSTASSAFGDTPLTQNVPLKKVGQLSAQEIQSDATLLKSVFENAYGGKGVLLPNQYQSLIESLDTIHQSAQSWNSDSFCDALSSITEKINDFHLTVHIEDRTCGRIWPQSHVGNNVAQGNANPTWSLISKSAKGNAVDILAIRKMTSALSADWNGFLDAVNLLIKKRQPFVIDMRGNPGGDVQNGLELARLLFGLKDVDSIPTARKTTYRRRTPDAWSVLANAFWLQKQKYEEQNITPPPYLMAQYNSLVDWYNKALQGLVPPLQTVDAGNVEIDLSNVFPKSVYIVVDRNCGSSCELVLEALEKHPNVKTVGENTTGVVQFGNVGQTYLPNSHIVVSVPTQGSIYQDGRQIEKVGYTPKYQVQPGNDALEFTLNNFF